MPVTPSLETLLDAQVDALDRLVGDVRGGVRGPGHFDALEERADDIARQIRAAFRARRKAK